MLNKMEEEELTKTWKWKLYVKIEKLFRRLKLI